MKLTLLHNITKVILNPNLDPGCLTQKVIGHDRICVVANKMYRWKEAPSGLQKIAF